MNGSNDGRSGEPSRTFAPNMARLRSQVRLGSPDLPILLADALSDSRPNRTASAKAAPLSTSLRTWDLGISSTYGRFLGIAGRVFCLFSYGCHICCVSILLETLVFPINLYVHNNVKDVESGAAKADPTGRQIIYRECEVAA